MIGTRSAALVLAALAIVLLFANADASSHASAVVQDVRWDTKRSISVLELAEVAPTVDCDQVPISFEEQNGRFHFVEGAGQACAEVHFVVNFTADVREAELRFRADRRIFSGTASPTTSNSFRERLFAYNQSMVRVEERVIFATADPAEGLRDFAFRFAVPPGVAQMTFGWFFHDTTGGEESRAYGSTIEGLSLHLLDQQLPAPSETQLVEEVVNDTRFTVVAANVSLPPAWEPDDRGSLRITVAETVELVQVVPQSGPPLNLTLIDQTLSRGKRTMQLSNVLVDELGHDSYTFHLQDSAAAQSPNPAVPRPTIYWLAYAALICPVLPLPGATFASWKYRQETGWARPQRSIPLAATGVVATTYFVILLLTVNERLLREMGTLPLSGSAASVYSIMLLLLIIGIAIWLLAGRVLLNHLRGELTENRRLVRELERSNQDLQQFAYVASHDLREPLRSIAGYSRLLDSEGKGLTSESREYVGHVRDSAARMSALIDALLQYAKVQNSREPKDRVELEKVLDDSKRALSATIQESDAQIDHDPLPTVTGDTAQLSSVFQNLLSNAIKFRKPSTTPVVRVSAARENGSWRIAVRDNGIGIDPTNADKLFVIFQRLHARSAYPGTGIGLAMAKRIIERHGGQIGFDSKPGEGSEFWFTLPAASDEE